MLNELICYAQNKIDECVANGEDTPTIRYWAGYLDGLLTMKRKMEGNDGTTDKSAL